MGDGVEKIANGRVAAELRAQGRRVHLLALGSAALTTALVLVALLF